MSGFVLTWVANSAAIWLVASVFSGVSIGSWTDAFVAGLVLTVINAIVKPILVVLTLPITVMTVSFAMDAPVLRVGGGWCEDQRLQVTRRRGA